MMLITGTLVLFAGIVLAPLLAHENTEVTIGYRVAFGASIVAFVGASYTFSLQARNIGQWNIVRVSQPVLSLIVIIILWRLRILSLVSALVALSATMLIQLCWAYRCCRVSGLAPGHARRELVRPLSRYGVAQIAALTPATLNAQLDQLILSQSVPSADLGRYAIAVSLTLLPIPVVSAIGNVAFPRLAASGRDGTNSYRVQRLAVISSAVLAAGLLCPLALVAYWVVPLVFGGAYSGVVPLLWIMTPGAVCLACNQVVGDLLRGRKLPIVVARAEGVAVVFTVVLLFALLPFIGVYSAAIASTVAYAVALFVMLRHVRAPSRDHSKDRRVARHRARMES
jgi:O-antigen/teichoic acid export membrane protein